MKIFNALLKTNYIQIFLSRELKGMNMFKNIKQIFLCFDYCDEIPEYILDLDFVEYLDVNGKGISEIPEGIKKMKSLKELSLVDNEINRIPDFIYDMPNLELVNLRHNYVHPRLVKKSHIKIII